MPKAMLHPRIALYEDGFTNEKEVDTTRSGSFVPEDDSVQVAESASRPVSEVLANEPREGRACYYDIALARSGDKGDTANIGVMARSPKAFAWLDRHLTAQLVKDLFQELCKGKVVRYSLPNMQGFNFL